MNTKSTDYMIGLFTGVVLMLAVYSCTHNPLHAEELGSGGPGTSEFNPLYVKIVE